MLVIAAQLLQGLEQGQKKTTRVLRKISARGAG
jgi:hypothetical protein